MFPVQVSCLILVFVVNLVIICGKEEPVEAEFRKLVNDIPDKLLYLYRHEKLLHDELMCKRPNKNLLKEMIEKVTLANGWVENEWVPRLKTKFDQLKEKWKSLRGYVEDEIELVNNRILGKLDFLERHEGPFHVDMVNGTVPYHKDVLRRRIKQVKHANSHLNKLVGEYESLFKRLKQKWTKYRPGAKSAASVNRSILMRRLARIRKMRKQLSLANLTKGAGVEKRQRGNFSSSTSKKRPASSRARRQSTGRTRTTTTTTTRDEAQKQSTQIVPTIA